MACGAQFRFSDAELFCAWILNVVNAMAICADRNILVALHQCSTMYALLVLEKYFFVALPTGLGYMGTRLVWYLDIMGTMTVGTDGCIQVASLRDLGVHAIQGKRVIAGMTFLTSKVVRARKLSGRLVADLRVRMCSNVRMAGFALNSGRAMDGICQNLGIDE
jgi:hypothetical protein